MRLRVAAVQLNSTADHGREPGRRRPADARRGGGRRTADRTPREVDGDRLRASSCAPRAAAARRRRAIGVGARDRARELARRPGGRARSSSAPRRTARSSPTPRVHVDPDGEVRAVYRKVHMFDVEVDGPGLSRVRRSSSRARRSCSRRPPTASSWACRSATTCASPSCSGSSRVRGARVIALPAGVHAGDDARPLGDARAGARDREPGVRDRRQPGRRAPGAASTPAGAR